MTKKKRTQQDIENEGAFIIICALVLHNCCFGPEIHARNKRLMDQQDNPDDDDPAASSSAPATKRRRHQVLDDDEQAIALALAKGNQHNDEQQTPEGEEGDDGPGDHSSSESDVQNSNGRESGVEDIPDEGNQEDEEDSCGWDDHVAPQNKVWLYFHLDWHLFSVSFSRLSLIL